MDLLQPAVYKSGTGTRGRGRGCGDACVGTWDLGTRDLRTLSMGRGDVWDGDGGTSNTGTQGTTMSIEKVGGKCDISHFPREYVLVKATHLALLTVPPCLFTKRRLGEDSVH